MAVDPKDLYQGICPKLTPAGEPCERPYPHRGRHSLTFDKRRWHREWKENNRERWDAYTLKYRTDRKAKIDAIKLEEGCIDCGYNECAEALHFDHVRGTKLFNVSKPGNLTIDALSAEILKCEVRCANCHAVVTMKRRELADVG